MADGTRTHDNQNHNLALYRLNYGHHKRAHFYRVAVQKVKKSLKTKACLTRSTPCADNKIMRKTLVLMGLVAFTPVIHAQQVGTTSMPLTGSGRLGVEAGGYLNRGAGSGMLARYIGALDSETAFEVGLGGATGAHGARALGMFRRRLMAEDMTWPSLAMRGGFESYGDESSRRRNAVGGGPLLSKGFAASGQEFYAFLHPTAKIGLEDDSNEFVWVNEAALGVNTLLPTETAMVASLEMNVGLTNAASSLMVGIATDFE